MGVVYLPETPREPQRPTASPTEYPPGTIWESPDGSRWVIEWDNQDKRYWWFPTRSTKTNVEVRGQGQ